MFYKEISNESEGLFPEFDMKPKYFKRTYDLQEWGNQISLINDKFDQQNYDIYPIYEYILSSNSEIPYQLLIDSHLLANLLNHFNQLVFNLLEKQATENAENFHGRKMKLSDPYFIFCIRIFVFLLKTDFLIQNSVFSYDFFISLSMLCFNESMYCKIMQEGPNKYHLLCVESLKLVKLMFELSQEILLLFEEKFNFSYCVIRQFKETQVFEIKYHLIASLMPWMPYYPGNKQVFNLYFNEIESIRNKKTNTNSNYDKEILEQDNKFNFISLLLSGILKFIQARPKPNNQKNIEEEEEEAKEEEEENNEFLYITMDYAYSKGVIKIASSALKCSHEPTVLYGFKIINCYLNEKRITENDIVSFLSDIRGENDSEDKLPVLLNYSEKICKEEARMLEFLLYIMPQDAFQTFFDETFVSYIFNILNDKKFKWKLYLYKFIGHLLIQMNFNFIEGLIRDIDIIDFLSDIRNSADDIIIELFFEGLYRIMQNSDELKEILINKGIEEEINQYIEDSDFSDKAQAILNLIQS